MNIFALQRVHDTVMFKFHATHLCTATHLYVIIIAFLHLFFNRMNQKNKSRFIENLIFKAFDYQECLTTNKRDEKTPSRLFVAQEEGFWLSPKHPRLTALAVYHAVIVFARRAPPR